MKLYGRKVTIYQMLWLLGLFIAAVYSASFIMSLLKAPQIIRFIFYFSVGYAFGALAEAYIVKNGEKDE